MTITFMRLKKKGKWLCAQCGKSVKGNKCCSPFKFKKD